MKRPTPARLLIVMIAAFASTGIASAQAPDISQGADPSAVYLGTDYEHVETRTGRVYLNIPLLADHSQRGDLNFSYHVVWGGLGAWLTACVKVYNGYQCHYAPSNYSGSTSMGPSPIMDGGLAQETTYPPPKTHYLPISSSDGSSHIAQPVLSSNPLYGETTDGTGIQVPPTCAQYRCIIDNRGRLFSEQNGSGFWSITDRNGSQMTQQSSGTLSSDFGPLEFALGTQSGFTYAWTMTDTVGRTWSLAPASSTSGCPSSVGADHATIWTTPGPNGGTRSFEFCYSEISISTGLPSYSSVYHANVSQFVANLDFLTAIILPDGTNWQFQYNDSYGDLTKLTLPTGGTISYQYTTAVDPYSIASYLRTLSSRTIFDGANSNTWTYALSNSNNVVTYTRTDPLGNDTVSSTPLTVFLNGQTQYYAGSVSNGTLLKTLSMTYLQTPNGTGPCSLPGLPLTTTTTWPNGQTSSVSLTYDSGFTFGCYTSNGYSGQSTNSRYGIVTSKTETDYGGATLRQTNTEYEWQVNSNFLTANWLSFPYQAGVTGSGATASVSCFFGTAQSCTTYAYDGLGNNTSVTQSLNTGPSPVTQYGHNSYGMRTSMTDPKNNTTTYGYDSSGVCMNLITNPLGQTAHLTCDSNTEQITDYQDQNSQHTQYQYDVMLRPTQINYPDGGQTTFGYGNVQYGGTYIVSSEKVNTSGSSRVSYVWSDGLGRKARVAVTNGESLPYDETQNTCFNSVGLVSLQGYPFQDGGWNNPISCSVAGDLYAYDALGRPLKITHADGSYGLTSYSGDCATVSDEQGKTRQLCYDGLERLASVTENPGGLNYTTTYAYSALNDLSSVVQGSETRSFAYDSLSRLTSATNPESGTTTYTYDAASNVATRIDARNITTTYSYDTLNRLTSKTYSDGTPTAQFSYDQTAPWGWSTLNTKGRMSSEQNAQGGSAFSYDAMGRVIHRGQCGPLTCGWTGYDVLVTYNLLGGPTSINEAQQAVTLSQSFNAAGLPTQITSSLVDSQHPATLVSGVHYNGAGGTTSYLLGNNLTETAAYNGLVQPCRMNVNSSGALLSSCTASVPSGNLLDLTTGFNYGTGDNGNVMSWASTGQQTFNRSYSYDGVNRLATMSAPGSTCNGLSWSYDQWGNRTAQTVTGGTCGSSQLTFNSYNHVTNSGFQYDAAGNMTHDASHSYTYDAENRIAKVDGGATANYAYDAVGNRVEKVVGGAKTDYIYDAANRVMMEVNQSLAWQAGYVYLGGQLLAEYESGTTYFVSADHLGSTRLLTNISGVVVDSIDYLPFGEQIAGASATTRKFTGYERDSETGLDNAQARYNSSSLGRFMSPDPLAGHQQDPQTLNRYVYVRNNPLTLTDPTGLDFYLSCSHSAGNGDTCQQVDVGDQKVWVQGTTDDNGKFNATVVTSASLLDPNSGNTATVNQNGVQITTANGTSQGVFITGTPAANNVQGEGALKGFTFDINGNCGGTCLSSGSFKFAGTPAEARAALKAAGAFNYGFWDALNATQFGHHPYTDQFRFGSGPSPHLSVPWDVIPGSSEYGSQPIINPWSTNPATGDFHVDPTTGSAHFWCANFSIGCSE